MHIIRQNRTNCQSDTNSSFGAALRQETMLCLTVSYPNLVSIIMKPGEKNKVLFSFETC